MLDDLEQRHDMDETWAIPGRTEPHRSPAPGAARPRLLPERGRQGDSSLSLVLNIAVLVPVCLGLTLNTAWAIGAFGPRTEGRSILLAMYGSILLVSDALDDERFTVTTYDWQSRRFVDLFTKRRPKRPTSAPRR